MHRNHTEPFIHFSQRIKRSQNASRRKITHHFVLPSPKWYFWCDADPQSRRQIDTYDLRSILAPECRRQEKNDSRFVMAILLLLLLLIRLHRRHRRRFVRTSNMYMNILSQFSSLLALGPIYCWYKNASSEWWSDTENAFIVIRKRNKFWASATHK